MSKRAYKSNRNVYYSCKFHVVWCPKYQRKLLVEQIAARLEQIIREVCSEHEAEVLSLDIQPDHVHLLVECEPQFGIHRLVRSIKGRSSRYLRAEFPVLKRKLPTLWTNSYFVSTVGGAPLATIRQYISHTIPRMVSKGMSKQAYKFRLYPTRKQRECLQKTLDACRTLYNAALTERRDAYNFHVKQHPGYYDENTCKRLSHEVQINYYSQANQLPDIKGICEEYSDVHSQVLQDVLRRVKFAFDAFFRRGRNSEDPGYPRFQAKGRYDSFTYPQAGFSLTHDSGVCLSKIGSIKVKLHREIRGTVKACTIKREGETWYVVLAYDVETEPMEANTEAVGIDLGLLHFATLSDGSTIENPRYLRKAEQRVEHWQQVLSRKKRGSHRRRKAVKRLAKAHRKVANRCRDFLHKQAGSWSMPMA